MEIHYVIIRRTPFPCARAEGVMGLFFSFRGRSPRAAAEARFIVR